MLEEKKTILNIDIADGEFKKFPDKKIKQNKNCQRKNFILSFPRCSLPSMQDIEFLIDFLREF